VELTVNNVLALYLIRDFEYFRNLGPSEALQCAGAVALLFGLMNLFARTLGGVVGDRCGERWGLAGRVKWLFAALLIEGLMLMLFSRMSVLITAIPMLLLFSLFVQMSEGATYAVVPFINPRALGSVAGIVGAGGNAGAVAAGFLFKSEALSWSTALLVLGAVVTLCSFATLSVTFAPQAEIAAQLATEQALAERRLQPDPSY
jgi:NNP family nitrate/nitrite transporter-like MFS transporter